MPAHRTRDTNHSLQVSSIPQAPTVTIISPTPRAFTFPFHDSDLYISPSTSPFEPDLKQLSLTNPLPRALSPTSSITSDSSQSSSNIHLQPQPQELTPVPASHTLASVQRRRKSVGGESLERRPRKGDEDYIKRPENAFILFRRKCCEERHAPEVGLDEPKDVSSPKKQRQADLSKTISQQWKGLSQEERQHWENLAKEKKKEHEQMYPNYVYRPQRTKPTKGKKVKGRRGFESEQDMDADSFSCTLPVNVPSSSKHHGRARSAPTPPPTYQTISIPTVYMPSCPPSPSMYHARRTSLPRLSLDQDLPQRTTYQSDEAFMHPSFHHPHDFNDGSFQNSEMFQGMFDLPGHSTPLHNNKHALLTSISIPQDDMISPTHMISPTSSYCSASPSTPQHSPFTPLTGYPHSRPDVSDGYLPEAQQCIDNSYMQYPSAYGWGNHGMWPATNGGMVQQDEFDINAIPTAELSIPDYSTDDMHHTTSSSTLAMAVAPPQNDDRTPRPQNQGDESDMFSGMFNFNEPMMW